MTMKCPKCDALCTQALGTGPVCGQADCHYSCRPSIEAFPAHAMQPFTKVPLKLPDWRENLAPWLCRVMRYLYGRREVFFGHLEEIAYHQQERAFKMQDVWDCAAEAADRPKPDWSWDPTGGTR